jgi:glycopeptide antibiotics resistance protein
MDRIFFLGYEFLATFIPFIIAFLIFANIYKHKGIRILKIHSVLTFVFAIYVVAVFHFTGTGTLYDALLYQLEMKQGQINFIPFINEIDVVAYLQNILLFIPFGFLIPLIWRQMGKVKNILLSGFSFSLLIEISQLLNNRRTDIDDLILNTLGAVLGYAVCKLICSMLNKTDNSDSYYKFEPFIYIGVMFIGRFLLFNEFGMAKLLYGI